MHSQYTHSSPYTAAPPPPPGGRRRRPTSPPTRMRLNPSLPPFHLFSVLSRASNPSSPLLLRTVTAFLGSHAVLDPSSLPPSSLPPFPSSRLLRASPPTRTSSKRSVSRSSGSGRTTGTSSATPRTSSGARGAAAFRARGRRRRSVTTCVEIKIRDAVRPEPPASTSTSSTRRLLDSVAVPVPHRSTEPARPRRRREMT